MPTLVWLRGDLRVHDNPALHHAARDSGGQVIALFIISPAQWQQHDWAPVKVDFILRHLGVLSETLARLNIPLIIAHAPTFADQPRLILHLAREHRCDALYFNDEFEINESRRDDAVKELLGKHSVAVRRFNDQCLARPGDVRTGENNYYTVFTPFRRALYKHLTDRGLGEALAPLAPPKKQDSAGIAPSPIPASVDGFTSTVPTDLWLAGEAVARKRLRDFIANHATDYKSSRNFPAVPGTSVLSPYLAVGAISARQCMAAALEANHHQLDSGDPGLATWMSEIAWREFYRHVIVGFPRVSMGRAFKPATERIRWNDDTAAFDAWCAGRTGIPIVDAGMRQLLATGWMHNRVRMIVAMYLTKDLFIHWCRGEQHFMRHLIDGDLASNNGGWQWSASTGTDAAPYFRIFNPVTQSRKFDPDGAYIKRWVPQLADVEGGEDGPIHDLSGIPALQLARIDYRAPLVDRAAVKDRVLKAFGAIAPSR